MGGPGQGYSGRPSDTASDRLTVAVRIRPLATNERPRGRAANALDDKMITLQDIDSEKKDVLRQKRCKEKHFVFDMAFGEDSTQKDLYEKTTKQLVDDVLQGFNAAVFAYGPTGSGKTYTMVGTGEQPGIMVRALNDIFKAIEVRQEETEFQMTLSYLEIYNESIRDLLNPGSGTLELREDSKKGTIEVTGLTGITTLNTKEVMRLLTRGNKQRTMESTAANKTSSRSHALLQVNVRQYSRVRDVHETVRVGKLYMIDLAGSERAKRTKNQGKRLQEGAHINRSLLALGNCINALAMKGSKYVNFRDSKLTRLLKDALSGNCRTVMVAHISPAMAQRDETFNTLIYADRAKNITNKVKRNVLDVTHQVSQYQNIITELKDEIGRLKTKLTDQDYVQEPDPSSVPRSREEEEELKRLRAELVELFREQMELRQQMMEIDNVLLWLAMEFEKQTIFINEYEQDRVRHPRRGTHNRRSSESDISTSCSDEGMNQSTDSYEDETDSDEPAEVTQAWDDLRYIQDEELRYQEMRKNVESDLQEVKSKANNLEETLPNKISTDEQRELLELLLKTHLLEIENMEMRRNQLMKDHELRRRDMMILRYDRQRALCDEIISRQRRLIDDLETGRGSDHLQMPVELQEMYNLYTQELQGSGQRNSRFINELNDVLRTPSMLSLRGGLDMPLHSQLQALSEDKTRLPPISAEKEDRLFQQIPRRNSLDIEKIRQPATPLSLRSPTCSAGIGLPKIQIGSSSATGSVRSAPETPTCDQPTTRSLPGSAGEQRLPTVQGGSTARVRSDPPSTAPVSRDTPSSDDSTASVSRREIKQSLRVLYGTQDKRGRFKHRSRSIGDISTALQSRRSTLRRSTSYDDLYSIPEQKNTRVNRRRIKRTSSGLSFRQSGASVPTSASTDETSYEFKLPSLANKIQRNRTLSQDGGSIPRLPSIGGRKNKPRFHPPRSRSDSISSMVSFSLNR